MEKVKNLQEHKWALELYWKELGRFEFEKPIGEQKNDLRIESDLVEVSKVKDLHDYRYLAGSMGIQVTLVTRSNRFR